MQRVTRWLLRRFCSKRPFEETSNKDLFKRCNVDSEEFFKRFKGNVDFKNKTVLDIGCGIGNTSLYMSLKGAKKVVGIDINQKGLDFAKKQAKQYPQLSGILEYKTPEEMKNEKFDIVFSKDSFEHYSQPEKFIKIMKQYTKPSGQLVIGFSPLWKSPYGAHITDFTRLPWVHLLFPEHILICELSRFLNDKTVDSFDQIAGGLNKMTLKRYKKIIEKEALVVHYFQTNISSNPKEQCILKLFSAIASIPFLKEYFTVNLYSILTLKS
jgi:SAM-dependent methyltransferase